MDVLGDDAWEQEEYIPPSYDWEPTEGSEEYGEAPPDPESVAVPEEEPSADAAAEEAPPEEAEDKEPVPPDPEFQQFEVDDDEPEDDQISCDYEPGSRPPEESDGGGEAGGSETEEDLAAPKLEFILEEDPEPEAEDDDDSSSSSSSEGDETAAMFELDEEDRLAEEVKAKAAEEAAAATKMQAMARGRSAKAEVKNKAAEAAAAAAAATAAAEAAEEVVRDSDFHLVEGAKFAEPEGPKGDGLRGSGKITRVRVPPRYNQDALVDDRPVENPELPAIRAQLKRLGPLGQQLQALAIQHAKVRNAVAPRGSPPSAVCCCSRLSTGTCLVPSSHLTRLSTSPAPPSTHPARRQAERRTFKHTPHGRREAVSEAAWWGCLLESLGLPSLASLGVALSSGQEGANVATNVTTHI